MTTILLQASFRGELAGFLSGLLTVYVICIFGYIVSQMVFAFGVRVPYSRPLNAVLNFLRDVSEPYLRLFRPLPLRVGPLDLTPLVAILVLQIVGGMVISLIAP